MFSCAFRLWYHVLLLLEGFGSILTWDWASQIKEWSLDLSACEKYLSDVLQRSLLFALRLSTTVMRSTTLLPYLWCHGKSGYFSVRIILITVRILFLNLHNCNAFLFQKFFTFKFALFYPMSVISNPPPQTGRYGVVSWTQLSGDCLSHTPKF